MTKEIAVHTITTLFFDIDNTLIDHTTAQLIAIELFRKKYFPHAAKENFTKTWITLQERYWERYMRKEITFSEQRSIRLTEVLSIFGKVINKKEMEQAQQFYFTAYENALKSFSSVLELFALIKKKKLKIGILSNGNKEQQIKKLKKLTILNYIDQELFFISEDVGVSKPDPAFFLLAQKKAQSLPENILFIGDSTHLDILPAKKLGWHTLQIDHFLKYSDKEVVTSFEEVITAFNK